jgi:hypothetical protein
MKMLLEKIVIAELRPTQVEEPAAETAGAPDILRNDGDCGLAEIGKRQRWPLVMAATS